MIGILDIGNLSMDEFDIVCVMYIDKCGYARATRRMRLTTMRFVECGFDWDTKRGEEGKESSRW